jgi:hypothetical protein
MAFGAFVRLDGPVEGLIHISELSNRRIQHPKDVVKEGDVVPVKLVRIEKDRHRLGLSLRQARNDAEAMGFVFDANGAVIDYPDDVREQFGVGPRDESQPRPARRSREPQSAQEAIEQAVRESEPVSAFAHAFAQALENAEAGANLTVKEAVEAAAGPSEDAAAEEAAVAEAPAAVEAEVPAVEAPDADSEALAVEAEAPTAEAEAPAAEAPAAAAEAPVDEVAAEAEAPAAEAAADDAEVPVAEAPAAPEETTVAAEEEASASAEETALHLKRPLPIRLNQAFLHRRPKHRRKRPLRMTPPRRMTPRPHRPWLLMGRMLLLGLRSRTPGVPGDRGDQDGR